MTKVFFTFLFISASFLLGQNNNPTIPKDSLTNQTTDSLSVAVAATALAPRENLVKVSFPVLSLPAISFQYERKIWRKQAVGLSVNFVGKQQFPILKMLANQLDNEEDAYAKQQLHRIKFQSYSFTPEWKFYFGKDIFQGFYVAPFIRYAHYDIKFPLQVIEDKIEDRLRSVNFKGNFNSVTYGLSIGAQWKIYENFYLDWLIVGPHLGHAKTKLHAKTKFSKQEQENILYSLDLLKQSINGERIGDKINLNYDVNDDGAEIRFKNPWLGIRMQVGVAYRF